MGQPNTVAADVAAFAVEEIERLKKEILVGIPSSRHKAVIKQFDNVLYRVERWYVYSRIGERG